MILSILLTEFLMHQLMRYFVTKNSKQKLFTEKILSNSDQILVQIFHKQLFTINQKLKKSMTGSSTGNNLEGMNTSIDIYFYDQQQQQRNFLNQMNKKDSKKEIQEYIEPAQSQKSIKSSGSNHKTEKSLYHNFQKHSIITLKYMISLGYLKKDDEAHVIARKIWNKFLDSSIKSKEVFTILFGNSQKDQTQVKQLFQKYGFGGIVENSYHLICNAQHVLRQLAIQQVTQQALDKHLKIRKITRKDSFRLYMLSLVQQLKGGTILKRISKEKSEEISNYFESEKRESF